MYSSDLNSQTFDLRTPWLTLNRKKLKKIQNIFLHVSCHSRVQRSYYFYRNSLN